MLSRRVETTAMASASNYDPKQRAAAAANITARCLNANINPSFNTRAATGMRLTETYREYQYSPAVGLNKDRHLKKDEIKQYVEKALQLRDERGGMPVVSSPIWGFKAGGGT